MMTLTKLNTLLDTHSLDLTDIKILEALNAGCKTLDAVAAFAGRDKKRQWCLNRINALKEKGVVKQKDNKRLVSRKGKKILEKINESV